MKKVLSIISLLIVLMLAVSLAACGGQNLNGTYTLIELHDAGADDPDVLSMYTEDTIPTLVINNTKAVVTMDGETEVYVIDYEAETMTIDEISMPYFVEDNKITIGFSSIYLVFEKAK